MGSLYLKKKGKCGVTVEGGGEGGMVRGRRGMTREFCVTTADFSPGLLSVPHQKERERKHGRVAAAVRF